MRTMMDRLGRVEKENKSLKQRIELIEHKLSQSLRQKKGVVKTGLGGSKHSLETREGIKDAIRKGHADFLIMKRYRISPRSLSAFKAQVTMDR